MPLSARRCAGCGGPLPETPSETRQIKCTFCGIVNDLAPSASGPRQVAIHIDTAGLGKIATGVGRIVRRIVLLTVLLVLVGALAAVYFASRQVDHFTQTMTDQARRAAAPPQPLAPAELATLGSVGWREVTATAPADWAAFEPVANVPWVLAMARAWAPDARLTRIDVSRLGAAGTLDLNSGTEDVAGYRFVSPGRIDAWVERADRGGTPTDVGYQLMLKAAQRKVTALVSHGRPSDREWPPARVDARHTGDMLAAARKRGLPDYPFYNGYMIHNAREGWVWYLQSLSAGEPLPRVRARDGAVYPFHR